ncbi:Sh3 domain-binding protein 5 [Plakobranchus ocellatus]|uniref:Sh3 domain-binding protein 5 n=1 Tax=Plakobranchus ocellatus TaxID=259542 RepID=A0AAV4B5L5_9GAST|nr:Sh3 domain-binding protein 5 [Plakobranchus ocellatus]
MTTLSSARNSASLDKEAPLDPRVKVELEILNQCASDVNRLERELDEARSKYQQNFTACSQKLESLKKNLGTSIKKARPYYELKEKAREAQSEALRSARKFQSANGVYLAAKETISLAELRLMDDKAASLSAAWQEMLNHALMRVTEAEREKTASEKEHLDRAARFADIEKQMGQFEKSQKRSIGKARKYFETKKELEIKLQVTEAEREKTASEKEHLDRAARFADIEKQMGQFEKSQKRSIGKARKYFETKKELEIKLQQVKQSIQDLQQAMASAKIRYSGALRRLEAISDCIHEQRRQELVLMYPREPGVGAEEDQWTEKTLPTLSTCDNDGGSGDYDDDYEFDEDDDYEDIDSDSVFRTRVLTTSLDEEDTSFIKTSRAKGKKKQLKRSQSLPVCTSRLARRHQVFEPLTPLSDRAEACPPDGESVGSGTSVGDCSISSISSQMAHEDSRSEQNDSASTRAVKSETFDSQSSLIADTLSSKDSDYEPLSHQHSEGSTLSSESETHESSDRTEPGEPKPESEVQTSELQAAETERCHEEPADSATLTSDIANLNNTVSSYSEVDPVSSNSQPLEPAISNS